MTHYESLTRRRFDLTKLSKDEQVVLGKLLERSEKARDWVKFGNDWRALVLGQLRELGSKEQIAHPLYKIGQDLEMRLGIERGEVAPPDYRDFIFDRIEEKYGSIYRFCKEEGFSEATLSKVNASKKNFSIETLYEIAGRLGLRLELVDDREPHTSIDTASLKQVIHMLSTELAELGNLHDRLKRVKPAERMQTLEQECGLFVSTPVAWLIEELRRIRERTRGAKVIKLLVARMKSTEEQLDALRRRLAELVDSPKPVNPRLTKK